VIDGAYVMLIILFYKDDKRLLNRI